MEVAHTSQGNPNPGRRSRQEAGSDGDAFDMDAPLEAPLDLYTMLGYRPSFMSGATTQQWLAVRLIEL